MEGNSIENNQSNDFLLVTTLSTCIVVSLSTFEKQETMKYQHILATQAGGPQVLQLREAELPEPKAGEVRVKVLAAGVAFPDILIRMGKYPGIPAFPFTPGYDLVGVIEKCGVSVKERAIGQSVAALTQWGSYSQYLCLPEREVVPVPEQID